MNVSDYICCSFAWSETEEGGEYWATVYNKVDDEISRQRHYIDLVMRFIEDNSILKEILEQMERDSSKGNGTPE